MERPDAVAPQSVAGPAQTEAAPRGLRERKKAQTREAILDAAIDLFEEQGYDATTVEDIAAAANISPRTFFRYFDTKLDVIMEHADVEVEESQQAMANRPASESPLEAARQVVHQQFASSVLAEGSRVAREMRVIVSTPSLWSPAREHVMDHQRALVPVFAERLGVGPEDLAAHVAAGAVTSAVWATLERWVAEGGDTERLSLMLDEAFDLLIALQ